MSCPAQARCASTLSSTALVGLGEGARYLIDYPFGCAEQKSSAALALLLSSDLGAAFGLGTVVPADYRARADTLLPELPRYQCSDGGFGYWAGSVHRGQCLPHELPPARHEGRRSTRHRAGSTTVAVGARLPRRRTEEAAGARAGAVAAAVGRRAGVQHEGAGRVRPQPGLQHHAAGRHRRPAADLRAVVPRRRDGCVERARPALRRRGRPHHERARGSKATRPTSRNATTACSTGSGAVERPLDGARPRRPRAARRRSGARAAARALAACRSRERPLGQHAGERDGARSRLSPTTSSFEAECRT